MKLPTNKKKIKVSEVSLGTTYDINKNLVKKYEKELTEEELQEKKDLIDKFTNDHNNHYHMMLCHDRRDYTIFHTNYSVNSVYADLIDCLKNRGKIMAIDLTKDEGAIEIWLMIEDEAYCYYFFPYDSAIVEF